LVVPVSMICLAKVSRSTMAAHSRAAQPVDDQQHRAVATMRNVGQIRSQLKGCLMAWLRRILDGFRSFNKEIGYPPSWGEGVSLYESPDGLLRADSSPGAVGGETPPSAKGAEDPE
jgi:hypothetical protein